MLQLRDVRPHPIFRSERAVPPSDIWACERRFEAGRRYLVTAPSGKGKSTLLHILYGLRHDYEGEASLKGKPLSAHKLAEKAAFRENQLALVFQDLRLFGHLSGWDNLMIRQRLRPSIGPEALREMAERLGMTPFLQQPAAQLSYGQQQRIAILRALAQPFELLLLDEPFSHLDEANVQAACALISEQCAARGAGYIVVSLGEAYALDYDERLLL